jgi:hypothetical protein
MVELNKAKAQKASVDLSRSASLPPKKTEVKTGGLMRSTPMGASLKPSALGGFPVVPPISTTDKPVIAELRGGLRKAASPTTEGPAETQGDVPAAAKVKPDTPPKKDFRTNLKPRAPPPEPKTVPTDELKNVFGALRRTKTQNYVAPDELKGNILRGKAGLSLTGGPKKTERTDEFKEAILQKKDDFKKAQQDGRSVTRQGSSASETSLPEGIAKRLEMQRTGTRSKTPTTSESPLQSPALTGPNRSSHVSTRSRHDIPGLGSEVAFKSPDFGEKAAASPVASVTRHKSSDSLGRVGGKVGGLADRFNPGLAGLLARGPPPASGPRNSVSSASGTPPAESEVAGPGPQLTHMTKNRARGPRRKAPTSVASPAEPKEQVKAVPQPEKKIVASPFQLSRLSFPSPELDFTASPIEEQTVAPQSEKPVISPKPEKFAAPTPETISRVDSRKSWIQDKPKPASEVISLADSSRRMPEEAKSVGQPSPLVGSTPIKTRPRSPTKVHEQVAALAALSQQSPKPESTGEASQPSSPKKLDRRRMSIFFDEQGQPSPKLGNEPVGSGPSSPTKGRSNSVMSRPSSPVKPRSNTVSSRPSSPVKDRFPALESPSFGKPAGNEKIDLKPSLPTSSPVKDRFTAFESPSFGKPAGKENIELKPSLPTSSPVKDRFPAFESPSFGKPAGNEKTELKPSLPIRGNAAPFGGGVGLGLSHGTTAPTPPPKPIEK